VIVPQAFDQKTIIDLDLRNRYQLTLLALSQDNQTEKFEINPSPVTRLKAGGLMVVIGSNQGLEKLPV
jgi:trk system potassium uptake protein TrkA